MKIADVSLMYRKGIFAIRIYIVKMIVTIAISKNGQETAKVNLPLQGHPSRKYNPPCSEEL
jgi:hypothetical protein